MALTTVTGASGIVTALHHLAADVGLGVLRDSGNAVEAAVEVAATLAVVARLPFRLAWFDTRPDIAAIEGVSFMDQAEATACARIAGKQPDAIAISALAQLLQLADE